MIRKIIHIDMDAFYASVEQRDNPSLKGKPIIVGGRPEERGVVCTASYEARKFSIRSAMPVKTALKLCPQLIIVKPNFKKYYEVSGQLIEFYKKYTDIIEPLSLDECYLDVTENKQNIAAATEIACMLKEKIKKELKITASVGVAPNKLLAKIASDINKPDGIFIIKPNQVDDFMKNLSVDRLWGVGKVTFKKMSEMNISTCSDLQRHSMLELIDKFGSFGETLYYFSRGIDERQVVIEHKIKSLASEETFYQDINDFTEIKKALFEHAEIVCKRLKSNNLKAKTITVKIKYHDFKLITRSRTINIYTDSFEDIFKIAGLLLKKTNAGIKKIRLVGLSVSNFSDNEQIFKEFY